MRRGGTLSLVVLAWITSALGVLAAPPAHRLQHRTLQGGQLHEATDAQGQRYGVLIYKNGSKREVHEGVPGKWLPATYRKEADPPPPPQGLPPQDVRVSTPPPDGVTIDDCVFISPQQVAAWGGFAAASLHATVAADLQTDTFRNSGVAATWRIAHLEQWTGNDTGNWATDFNTFTSAYYSTTPATLALRAAYGCDLFTLLSTDTTYCGQGFVLLPSAPSVMVQGNCAEGNLSYTHEHEHSLGLMHNVGDGGYAPICGPTAVGYGEAQFRTPISYQGGPRTPQESDPTAKWFSNGTSPIGTAQTAGTACLRLTVGTVAAYAASVVAPPVKKPIKPPKVRVSQ